MKNLLLVLFIISVYFAQGQEESPVEWSEIQYASEKPFSSVYYSDDNYFYAFIHDYHKIKVNGKSHHASTISISKYSKSGYEKEWTQVATSFEIDNEYVVLKNIFQVDDETFVFLENYNPEDGKRILYLKLVSKDGEVSDLEKVDEIQYEEKNSGYFDISISKNKSKFVILSRHYNIESSNFKLGVKVFNAFAENLWEKEIFLPVSQKEAAIKYVQVSENGDVFLMFRDISAQRKKDGSQTKYRILKISKKTTADDYEEIDLIFKHDLGKIYIDVDNTIGKTIITALYRKEEYLDGFYVGVIDQDIFEQSSSKYNDFSASFLSQASSHVKIKGESIKDFNWNYKLKKLINTEDEGFLLVYECDYFDVVKRYTDNGVLVTKKVLYFINHLFVAKMNDKGEMEWCEFVPKRQETKNHKIFSGSIVFYSNNLLTIIFNDNPKNFKQIQNNKKLKNLKAMKASGLVAVQIDENGNSTRKLLQDNKMTNIFIYPENVFAENRSANDIIVKGYVIKKRKRGPYYLGKINIYKY